MRMTLALRRVRKIDVVVEPRQRIIDELLVDPGSKANLDGRDCAWTGGEELDLLTPDDLDAVPRTSSPAAWTSCRTRRSCCGRRTPTAPRRVPGDRRGGQGLDDQARDVGGQPPGRAGGVVPQAVERGARPPLPLAHSRACPERGSIGIFNRSHYEEVVALRVHPEWLDGQKLPPGERGEAFWEERHEDINASNATSLATARRS